MRTLLSFLFCLCLSQAPAQPLSDKVQKMTDTLGNSKVLEYPIIYYECYHSKLYATFLRWEAAATTTELLHLQRYINPVVKTYAYWALVDRRYEGIDSIFTRLLSSNVGVEVIEGCLMDEYFISDQLYSRAYRDARDGGSSKTDSLLYVHQLAKLNSILISQDYNGIMLSAVLSSNNAQPSTYSKIRRLALENRNKGAIGALGEYRKKEDVQAILSLKAEAFAAIVAFPHPAFWPLLRQYADTTVSINYFAAVAAYKNADALNMLQKFYNKYQNTGALSEMYQGIEKNYSPRYKDLLRKLDDDIKRRLGL